MKSACTAESSRYLLFTDSEILYTQMEDERRNIELILCNSWAWSQDCCEDNPSKYVTKALNSLRFFCENKRKFGIFLFPFAEDRDRNIYQEPLIMCIFLPGRGREHLMLDSMPNLFQRKSALPAFLSFENSECFESQIFPNCRGIRDLTEDA